MRLSHWIPNGLTLSRLVAGLAFPVLPIGWRIPLIVLAAATDFLDGYLARRISANSTAGRWLDPLADKVFVLCLISTLIAEGVLAPAWAAALLARDVLVVVATVVVGLRGRRAELSAMKPRPLGKLTTALQFTLLFALVVDPRGWRELCIATATLSVLSAVDYLLAAIRRLRIG
ncbi:MAG: CDP-alcohol phosphatidyltransferase family protein [Gemmataceae bacterium]